MNGMRNLSLGLIIIQMSATNTVGWRCWRLVPELLFILLSEDNAHFTSIYRVPLQMLVLPAPVGDPWRGSNSSGFVAQAAGAGAPWNEVMR
jgi:hypothetical protein